MQTRRSFFLRLIVSAIALCLFSPEQGHSQGVAQPAFTSPVAIAAQSKRDHVIAEAKIQLVAALKVVLTGVMQGGQLEEANRINKAIENPDAAADESLVSLRGKAAQTVYRSAVQRATNEYIVSLKAALGQAMKAGQLDESNRITAEIKVFEAAIAAAANRTPGFINLVPLITPDKNTVAGTFTVEKTDVISSGKGEERLEIPYEVPEEYDFQISFTKTGTNCVVQILSCNGHPFIWVMSASGMFTFHYVKGSGIGANKTTVKVAGIKDNRRYTSLIKVRKNGAQAFLDGKLISKWDTDFSDVAEQGFWALRNKKVLGVGTGASKVTFHSIEVREVTGKGKILKP